MKTKLIALTLLATTLAFAPQGSKQAWAEGQNPAETYELLNLFGDVFERVRANYVEETADRDLIEAAVNGMLKSLDPHSSYMNKKTYGDMQVQTRGQFGGLGIEVTMEGGLIKVVSPIDDTPAFRAGLKTNDFLTHLDGEAVMGLTLEKAVEKMRGKVGTDITVTVRREGQDAFDVTITRAIIKLRSVRSRTEDKVGYVRITSFSENTSKGLGDAVDKLKEEMGDQMQGLVLDLRNNPGGLLDQAVAVSDAFLDKGEIVSTRSRDPDESQRFNARPGDITGGLPVVILINGGSASASEIVAGALQDHGRAILLGTKTFGKGSVQTIVPLPGHGAMRLTTARYYTPSGRSIQATGIEPDIQVAPAKVEELETRHGRREADLRGALDKGKNGPAEEEENKTDKAEDEKKKEVLDFQLMRAVDLIKGIAMFGGQK
ncbi:S41 family peptidase [Magnetospira sp. QH-2]|uniref:S41 family peptidase n=1 Tax=Magnetospira sp. (strain QH-2) TaxID=1288970 RepID=UPI0003E81587|nr:S41 family peptidase [Magnetospira sp. QH-2]CCQ74855.1 carboxy-terminal-processing protease [Magnetospira sp. QH-2]